MTNEFKKIIKNNETHYVLEDASAGATSAGSVASVSLPLGEIKRRIKKLKERAEKVSVPTTKPRNPTGMGSTPGRGTQVHKDKKHDQKMGKQKHKKPFYEQMIEELEALAELDKPSGSMFLKFRGKRLPGDEMMLLGYGGFGNTPKDVTVGNALVKPFPADDAYDVINKIESLFKDKDFVGVEKIVLDIPGSLSGQLRDVLDYAEQDPERFELYTGDDLEEPEAKTSGKVIGYGPDGKKIDRTPPKAQVGGSSRGIASTGMVTVQADSNGQRLINGLVSQGKLSRDTKVQGNKITLRKDDYSKMMSVLGNAKFQQMFTKVGSVAETQGSRPIDKFRSKPSWDDGSEPADKNSPYYVAWSGQAWDDEDTSRPKGDAGRILVINIDDKHTAQELAKHYDQLFKVGKFPDELAHSKYVDYSGTYVGSMKKMDGYEKEMLGYDLRSGIVKDYSKEDPVNELSKDTLRSYSQAAGREVGDDQRDARSARDKAIHHISHGELKKGAEWSDEADWLNKRAEKRASGIARATSKIAQKRMEEGDQPDHEISMASSELTSIAKDAARLLNIVRQRSEEEGLEAWQQSKITKAADYMNSVLQSISGDEEQGVAEGLNEFAPDGFNGDNNGEPRFIRQDNEPSNDGKYMIQVWDDTESYSVAVAFVQRKGPQQYIMYPVDNPELEGDGGLLDRAQEYVDEIEQNAIEGSKEDFIANKYMPLEAVLSNVLDEQGVAEDRDPEDEKISQQRAQANAMVQQQYAAHTAATQAHYEKMSDEELQNLAASIENQIDQIARQSHGGDYRPGSPLRQASNKAQELSSKLSTIRQVLDKRGMTEGMDSLTFWKREAQKARGAANINWYAIGVEHGKQGIVMNPPYGVGGKAVKLYSKGLDAGQQGVAEGPEENKKWRDQARDASKEKRPWSPTNLPNYKKSKEQEVEEDLSRRGFLRGLGAAALGATGVDSANARATPAWLEIVNKSIPLLQQGMTPQQVANKLGIEIPKGNTFAGPMGGEYGAILYAVQKLKNTQEDVAEAHPNSKIYDKCWTGFRKVPGKKRGEDDSCKKIKKEDAYLETLTRKLNEIVKQ